MRLPPYPRYVQVDGEWFSTDEIRYNLSPLPEAYMWAEIPDRRWFTRCDRCRVLRIVSDYYEVFPKDSEHGWWWECSRCIPVTIYRWGKAKQDALTVALKTLEGMRGQRDMWRRAFRTQVKPSYDELALQMVRAYREYKPVSLD